MAKDEVWECEYCKEEFNTEKECVKHENNCVIVTKLEHIRQNTKDLRTTATIFLVIWIIVQIISFFGWIATV